MSTSDHERDAFDHDDDLRALLRGGDPARSLSPADPAALASLLGDIMSADLDIRPEADTGGRATGTRGRNRLTWLVAAAAAAVIAGVGGYALSGLGGNGAGAPTARDSQSPTSGESNLEAGAPVAGLTTELTGGGEPSRCAAPDPSFIAAGTQAFQGTVTSIEGDTVTLETTDVFTGEVGETVQVTAPSQEFGALIQAVDFQVGQDYLVSAADGMVAVCGNSGPATGELRSLYDQAFVR